MQPDLMNVLYADRRTVLKALGAGAVLGGTTRSALAQEPNFEISVPDTIEINPGERITLDMSLTQLAPTPDPDSGHTESLHGIVGFQKCPSGVVNADEIECTPPSWMEYTIVDHSEEQGEWDGSSTAGEWQWISPDDITQGATRSFSVTIEIADSAEPGTHELFVICWSYPAGAMISPAPRADDRAAVTVSVDESDEPGDEADDEATETVLTEFNVIEHLEKEKNGLTQLTAHQQPAVHVDGQYKTEHDAGVGFYGDMAYGTHGVYYNTFTPETSGEHKIETRFRLEGDSLIKQFEFLPGTAYGQNFVGVVSVLAKAGDELIETDDGEQVPVGGEVLDTDERTVYNLAVPEWTTVLKEGTIEMATLLLEASGRLSGTVASSVVTGLQIAEILTERGVEADENFERLDSTLLSADLDAGTEYVVENNIVAISCVDLNKISPGRMVGMAHPGLSGVELIQALAGSFIELSVDGGIEHVTVTPS